MLLLLSTVPVLGSDTGASSLDLLWPSPLLKMVDPVAQQHNRELRRRILEMARTEPGVRKTNLGGWQSGVEFFERSDPAIALLRTRAYHAVFRYLQSMAPRGSHGKYEVSIGSAWANVNNRSHSNSPHIHPGVQIAGIYYVDDGGDQEGGVRLVDPRAQAAMIPVPAKWTFGMGEHVRVLSVPGLFVLFPAWLQHYVVGHDGPRPRVSVSFNVRLTFPEDEQVSAADPDAGYARSGGGGRSTSSRAVDTSDAPPDLSFTVPPHHQLSFLDSKEAAADMVVK